MCVRVCVYVYMYCNFRNQLGSMIFSVVSLPGAVLSCGVRGRPTATIRLLLFACLLLSVFFFHTAVPLSLRLNAFIICFDGGEQDGDTNNNDAVLVVVVAIPGNGQ